MSYNHKIRIFKESVVKYINIGKKYNKKYLYKLMIAML